MAFDDVRLSVDVERGAVGGPRWRTTVLGLSSGFEQRNIEWERNRYAWDIGYGVTNRDNFIAILVFFVARFGRANSFRFKDWSDFELERQLIGQTDGGTTLTFPVFKNYTSGPTTYQRFLTKPVINTATVWVNNVSITVVYDTTPGVSEASINTLTGILTLGSTVGGTTGEDIEVETEFDVPVRFDVDEFNLTLELYNAGAVQSIPIIEVRGE